MRLQNQIRFQANDYYAYLNLDCTASIGDIKRNYRNLALQWHPDKHAAGITRTRATDIFQKITDAHETLTNPDQRRSYDNVWNQKFRGRQLIPDWARNAGRRPGSADYTRASSCDSLLGRGASIERHASAPHVTQPRRETLFERVQKKACRPEKVVISNNRPSRSETPPPSPGKESSIPMYVTRRSFGKFEDVSYSTDIIGEVKGHVKSDIPDLKSAKLQPKAEQRKPQDKHKINTDDRQHVASAMGMSESEQEAFKSYVAELAKRKKRDQDWERIEREAEEAWLAAVEREKQEVERERQEKHREELTHSERKLQETLRQHLMTDKSTRVAVEPRAKARSSNSTLQPDPQIVTNTKETSSAVSPERVVENETLDSSWGLSTGLANLAGYAFGTMFSPFAGASPHDNSTS